MIFFWFLVISGIVLFVQSAIFRKWSLHKINYTRSFDKHSCYAGDQLELQEQLINNKWLPVPWLRIESLLPSAIVFGASENFTVSSSEYTQNHKSFFSLSPFTKVKRKHRIIASKRGWYKLQSVTLTSGDVFGNSTVLRTQAMEEELIVYPAPAALDLKDLPSHSWQGDIAVRRWIMPDPFVVAGTREYQQGDTLRQINWAATARTGALQSRQYDYTADRRIMVLLNVEDSREMWRDINNSDLIERGFEYAAGIVAAAVQEGVEVGFAANMPLRGDEESIICKPEGGREQFHYLLDRMARMELQRTEKFSDLLNRLSREGMSRTDFILFSSYWDDSLEQHAQVLRLQGNSAKIWVLEPTDQRRSASSERVEVVS